MSHSISGTLPRHLSLGLFLAFAVAVLAAVFGAWGMARYEHEHHHGHVDLWSVAYHTLQLFILHAPHLEHPVNWQIHVGRILSALFVFGAGIRGLSLLFRSEWLLLWTRWRGGHVVICGMGRLGRHLAEEYRHSKQRVIVIDSDANASHVHPGNTIVIVGDACEPAKLRMAGITRAKQLIAVCDEVQINVAVASLASQIITNDRLRQQTRWKYIAELGKRAGWLLGLQRGHKLTSWLFVPDAHLRQLLKSNHLFPNTGVNFEVNVRGLDIFSLAARQAFEAHPLDFQAIRKTSKTRVHLVIVGFGPMGQRLALQAARVAHFANLEKPKLTILEAADSPRLKDFQRRYPMFEKLIDLKTVDFSIESSDGELQILELLGRNEDQLVTLVYCWDSNADHVFSEAKLFQRLERDDELNFRMALALHRLNGSEMPRTLLFQTRECGFASLFSGDGGTYPLGSKISVFGTIEQTYSLEALLHESTDTMARALHEDWYRQEAARRNKENTPAKPAFRVWEQLEEVYRDTNRCAADHIRVKMRAINCRVERLGDSPMPLVEFDQAQIELLAEMEHARWCADHLLKGYSQASGPRNDIAKTHPDLVPWAELSESTKNYDRSQIRALPNALQKVGLGVYPGRKE